MSKLIESMKQEFSLFLHALQYYSRIPVGQIDFCEEKLTPALRYFPLVGIIVGGLAAVVFALFALALRLPQSVAAVAALAAMILATGALHEDGFADFFDGFGGGYTKERILEIMKDSRSGAYGVMALILAFLLKFSLFVSISSSQLPWVLVAAHSTSRFTPILMIRNSQYARVENSKAGHTRRKPCLLYTSDAADDLLCVDLGGRRITKKKTTHNHILTRRRSNTSGASTSHLH